MSLDALLRDRPDANEPEIREFLSGHLCRCTGYGSIVRAALEAARKLQEGKLQEESEHA
jgi:2-furoyl-CoA dehydrogenase 2Fe-2S iron sulfur subunit